jgi:hypothetical protein
MDEEIKNTSMSRVFYLMNVFENVDGGFNEASLSMEDLVKNWHKVVLHIFLNACIENKTSLK